jgi:two-component sensor histidine kinase
LSALARQQLSMFLPKDDEGRVRLAGPAVFLPASNVTSVSMVLHELATNASKYGALSTPAGKIQMSWSLLGEGSVLRLTWKESGGPAAASPDHKGFGSILLEKTTARFEPQYLPTGFQCAIELGLDTAVSGDFGISHSGRPD